MNIIVLDTETANTIEQPICYDIGWAVIDFDTREVIKTQSFTIAEVFLDKLLMNSAYYAEKVPTYWKEIKHGDRQLRSMYNTRMALLKDIHDYKVKRIYAHNAHFDKRSATISQRYLTCSKYRFFYPRNVEIHDTLAMSRKVFAHDEDYTNFCLEHDFRTKRNQNRLTAEILYRYLSGNLDFEEAHRGIDDVLIEKEILFACVDRGVSEYRIN